jgi:hypothetical protein
MSHQQVVEAAVQAAAKQGVEATVIVLGGGNGTAPAHVTVEHEHYQHSMTDSEVGAKLAQAEQHIAALTEQLTQRDQTISEMQQSVVTLDSGGGIVRQGQEQPTETVSIDAYDIKVLGISEDREKKVRKLYPTIGALREAATTGKLKELKLPGGQKAIIDIQERLLGKVPSERIPGAAPAAAGGNVAEGVPAGHTDRPWLDRLGAVKAKERDMQEWAAKLAAIKQAHPVETEMPDAEYDKLLDARHEHDIAKSQVVALVWGLGLDKEHLRGEAGNVDACLAGANLSHLTDTPQPRMVPGA